MRIGIDVRSLLDKEPSGVGEYTLNLLQHIFQLDQKNKYVLFYNIFKSGQDNLILDKFKNRFPNVEIRSFKIPNRLLNPCLCFLNFPKIDRLVGGVDVFFTPNFHFSALSKKCRKIVAIHDISFKIYPEFFSFKKQLWHSGFFVNAKKFIKKADKIIAVSNNTRKDLESFYNISADKINVAHSSIAKNFYDFKAQIINKNFGEDLIRIKNKYKLPNNFILSLSTLEPRKNIVSTIRAFDKLKKGNPERYKDLHLVIAGGRGWKYKDIYNQASLSPFKDKIIFTGYLERADKPYVYHLADLFVWPSFYEGFGFPPLEAMASGTAVVTSTASSLPEVVEDAAILVNPYDAGEIAKAIELVLEDKQLKQDLITRGFSQIEKFSWSEAAKKTISVFESLN